MSALLTGWATAILVWLGEIPGDSDPSYDA